MFTSSLASTSLRPAVLPPTLQPNAIAAMAPPVSRGMNALISLGCYALLGGAGLAAAHLQGKVLVPPPIVTGGTILLRDEPLPLPRPVAALPKGPEAAPKGEANRPQQTETTPPLAAENTASELLPTTFPTVNRSQETGFNSGLNAGSSLNSGPSSGDLTGGPTGSQPTELSMAQVRILSQVQPVYPTLAKAARIQGPVVLQMTIDTQGVPTAVQVASGPLALHAEAVRAARLWRFVAAMVDGRATPATFQLTIIFSLR